MKSPELQYEKSQRPEACYFGAEIILSGRPSEACIFAYSILESVCALSLDRSAWIRRPQLYLEWTKVWGYKSLLASDDVDAMLRWKVEKDMDKPRLICTCLTGVKLHFQHRHFLPLHSFHPGSFLICSTFYYPHIVSLIATWDICCGTSKRPLSSVAFRLLGFIDIVDLVVWIVFV